MAEKDYKDVTSGRVHRNLAELLVRRYGAPVVPYPNTSPSSSPADNITIPTTDPPVFMGSVRVNKFKDCSFSFGNCAACAIGSAFDMPVKAIYAMFRLVGGDPEDGASWRECCRVINGCAGGKVRYVANKGRLTFEQVAIVLNDGGYLVHFENHVSCLLDGEVYDSYIRGWRVIDEWRREPPMGWWVL